MPERAPTPPRLLDSNTFASQGSASVEIIDATSTRPSSSRLSLPDIRMNLVVADGLQLHTISLPARSAWASVNVKLEAAIGRNVALRIPRPFQPFLQPVGQVIDDDDQKSTGGAGNCYIVSHAHWRDFQVVCPACITIITSSLINFFINQLMRRTSSPCPCSPMHPPSLSALLHCQCLPPSRPHLTCNLYPMPPPSTAFACPSSLSGTKKFSVATLTIFAL